MGLGSRSNISDGIGIYLNLSLIVGRTPFFQDSTCPIQIGYPSHAASILEDALMNQLRNKLTQNPEKIVLGKYAFILIVFFWLGGCTIWNAYLDPDYESSRADRYSSASPHK